MKQPDTATATDVLTYPHALITVHPFREQPYAVWRQRRKTGDWVLTRFEDDQRNATIEALRGETP